MWRYILRIVFPFLWALLPLLLGMAEGVGRSPSLDAYRPQDREMVESLLKNVTFEAHGELSFRADAAVFQFLVDQPDFAAAVSRGLGLDQFHIQKEGEGYLVSHGHARGTFWVTERRADKVAYLATGTFEHPVLLMMGIHLRARSYVVEAFDQSSAQEPDAQQRIRVQAYLHIENPILGPLLNWLAPLIRGAFESKLTGAYRVAPDLSQRAYQEGENFLERVRRLPDLDPGRVAHFERLVRAQTKRVVSVEILDGKLPRG